MGDREQFWLAHVDACRIGGETQKTYCERHGLGLKTFRRWRSRLAGATHMAAAEGEPHRGEVKGGAKEDFSPFFDGPLARPQQRHKPPPCNMLSPANGGCEDFTGERGAGTLPEGRDFTGPRLVSG